MTDPDPRVSPTPDRLAELVEASAVFGPLSADARAAVVAAMEIREVRRGTTVIHQGARADGLLMVVRGRLRVELVGDDGGRTVLGEVGRGEVAGEMALITDGPRSADVVAIRDSRLAILPLAAFDALVAEHAGAMRAVSTVLIRKLVATAHGRGPTDAGATVVVVPVTDTPTTLTAAADLAATLARTVAGARLGNGDEARAEVGADAPPGALQEWCEGLATRSGGAVFLADAVASAWTDACAQQADRIVLVADASHAPSVRPIETAIAEGTGATRPRTELVLVHPAAAATPRNTRWWLAPRPVDRHHNVRSGSATDLERVARLVTGRAVGVVFSGGGARGIAHIGVLRALQARGIPIDAVGGASIGSIVGGAVARGDSPDAIATQIRAAVLDRSPVDITLPTVSVAAGGRVTERIKDGAGGLDLEDGWLNFFCVSTNLSTRALDVHTTGPAWVAIRSSFSVPGIFPPMHNDAGETLVDGGVLDNMPVSTMRSLHEGITVIAIDVGANKEFTGAGGSAEGAVSGWRALTQGARRRALGSAFGLPKLLMRLTELGAGDPGDRGDCYVRPGLEGVSLLDFDRFEDLVVGGERDAGPILDAWIASGGARHWA